MKLVYDEGENDEDDMNIYSKQLRESLLEDDELSAAEEGFMHGYDEAL